MLLDRLIETGKYEDALSLIIELESEGSYTVDGRKFYDEGNFNAAREYSKRVQSLLEHRISRDGDMSDVYLWRRYLQLDAPHRFEAFCKYVESDAPPAKQFYSPRRRYLKQVVDAYQDLFDGKTKLLMVELVKRAGKSQLGILATCYQSGRFPDRATLMEGTGEDLVDSFYKGCLEYLRPDTEYLFYDVFPDVSMVATKADSRIINLGEKSRFPTIMCRSIDARQVGLSEATNILYLDDCVEGYIEAQNKLRLEEKWRVISGDVMGRALEGTPIVACGTRYSVYDPMSRLEEEAQKNGWPYRVIKIPALNKNGESNYEFYNPRISRKQFTKEFFLQQKGMLSKPQFAAEFQQEPFEAKGLIFPEEKLNRYFELPVDKEPDGIIAVCDTAEGKGDSVMMPIAYLYGTDVFIEDVVFSDALPTYTKPECARKLLKHKVQQATFESNQAGTYFCRDVEEMVRAGGGLTAFKTKFTTSNKETRIITASDSILEHFYFKDSSLYDPQSDYGQMIKALTSYTRLARNQKNQHDDAPDGLSLLENEIRRLSTAQVKVYERFF